MFPHLSKSENFRKFRQGDRLLIIFQENNDLRRHPRIFKTKVISLYSSQISTLHGFFVLYDAESTLPLNVVLSESYRTTYSFTDVFLTTYFSLPVTNIFVMTRVNETTGVWLSVDFRDLSVTQVPNSMDKARVITCKRLNKAQMAGDESSLETSTLDLIRVFYQSGFT